jgi:hypothetical protein
LTTGSELKAKSVTTVVAFRLNVSVMTSPASNATLPVLFVCDPPAAMLTLSSAPLLISAQPADSARAAEPRLASANVAAAIRQSSRTRTAARSAHGPQYGPRKNALGPL